LNACANDSRWKSHYGLVLPLQTREMLARLATEYLNAFSRKHPHCCFANENQAPLTWLNAVDISSDSQESIVPRFIKKLHMKNIQEDALRQSHRGESYFSPAKDLILERSVCYGDMFTPLSGITDYYGPIWNSVLRAPRKSETQRHEDF
jgi:hypothetical protein